MAIPGGETVTLPKGTAAFLTQSLGGSFTLQIPSMNGLFRVSGKDADALGKTVETTGTENLGECLEEKVWACLKTCYDPEIPVNIVDLGLIYELAVAKTEGGGHRVDVKMTLTAPGCGMGVAIAADARERIESLPEVETANVEIVWEPLWSPERITPEGRRILGIE
ncbi:MAG: DUF59 domain-containing protein [Deltaproteobacteria bacterium]|nr:MAG: DUF59 domain-containing protein [Deltaproteobacteria bacterium]